jgi:hypothetical protein
MAGMKVTPNRLDPFEIEYQVASFRNLVYFLVMPKGSRQEPKIFVAGHPRTGTLSLHTLFKQNGLRSQHTSGNWRLWEYDAFSDRGPYRPFRLYDRYYHDALFLLNIRPAFNYLKSRMSHFLGRVTFSVGNVENEIIRRNNYFVRFVRHFADRDNFRIFNIEREGAFDFVCDELGLESRELPWRNKTKQHAPDEEIDKIHRAFANLGIDHQEQAPFLIPELTSAADLARWERMRREHEARIFI